jgi:hypothetical protein
MGTSENIKHIITIYKGWWVYVKVGVVVAAPISWEQTGEHITVSGSKFGHFHVFGTFLAAFSEVTTGSLLSDAVCLFGISPLSKLWNSCLPLSMWGPRCSSAKESLPSFRETIGGSMCGECTTLWKSRPHFFRCTCCMCVFLHLEDQSIDVQGNAVTCHVFVFLMMHHNAGWQD